MISALREDHNRAWQRGMDTARLEIDTAQLKREFLIWGAANKLDDLEHFAKLPDWRYITIGRAAWLMNNGAEVPATTTEFFLRQLQMLRAIAPEVAVVKDDIDDDKPLTSDAKRIIQYVNLYSYIDAVRVKYADEPETIEELIRKRIGGVQPPMAMLRKLYQHYREILKDSIDNRDNTLVAATVDPLITVVNILAASTGNASAMISSKKKVSSKAIKAASKATVKNIDADTNIVGLSPALLIGNTAALVYNTKNRKAMLYVAKAGAELGIKGTYITEFDESASFGKTIRKPKETFAKLLHNPNTKRVSEVMDNYIKGKRHDVNGKLNKEIIIIKVFK
jgi:hypothetical protein